MSDTPRSDAGILLDNFDAKRPPILIGGSKVVTHGLACELERERDALRQELDHYRAIAEKEGATIAVSERDEALRQRDAWRKCADDLASKLASVIDGDVPTLAHYESMKAPRP